MSIVRQYTSLNTAGIIDRLAPSINPKTTELKLNGNDLDDQAVKTLMKVLVHPKTSVLRAPLAVLDLWQNQIQLSGVRYIAQAVQRGLPLMTLNLSSNRLGVSGMQVLSQTLIDNKTVTSLSVGNNNLQDSGMVPLATLLKQNKTLTALYANSNSVSSVGAQVLFSALPHTKKLTTLYFSDNPLRDGWTQQVNATFAKNSSLQNLYLAFCHITDDGVKNLCDENTGMLAHHESLTQLDLSDNHIHEEGAIALKIALKTNTSLLTLNLTDKRNFSNPDSRKFSVDTQRGIETRLYLNAELANHFEYFDALIAFRRVQLLLIQREGNQMISNAFAMALALMQKDIKPPRTENLAAHHIELADKIFLPRRKLLLQMQKAEREFNQTTTTLECKQPIGDRLFSTACGLVSHLLPTSKESPAVRTRDKMRNSLTDLNSSFNRVMELQQTRTNTFENLKIVTTQLESFSKSILSKKSSEHNEKVVAYLEWLSEQVFAYFGWLSGQGEKMVKDMAVFIPAEEIIETVRQWQMALYDKTENLDDLLFLCLGDVIVALKRKNNIPLIAEKSQTLCETSSDQHLRR